MNPRLLLSVLGGLALLGACTPLVKPPPTPAVSPPFTPMARFALAAWKSVDGWYADNPLEAWSAFAAGCATLRNRPQWQPACEQAQRQPARSTDEARRFFEVQFDPWRVSYADEQGRDVDSGLITGYYEPVLRGARSRGAGFEVPLYAVPDDLVTVDLGELYPALKGERIRGRLTGRRVVPYYDRAALTRGDLLRGKEIVFVDSAVDAFFLQIQGSGRVTLPDGQVLRLAYADQNGHPYRAIGRYLVDRGELTVEQATAPGLRQWLRDHPERLAEVLNANPSVVFFREEKLIDQAAGPRGALGVPLTAGRSIAIDPRQLPLGAPVFLATTWPPANDAANAQRATSAPLARLMLAQDTGGAIRGPVRADLFWGLGPQAGELAGTLRQQGRLWLLWPKGQTPPAPSIDKPAAPQ
ncbi:MAG: murein transglycosylase A [Pseudomonadota bacterium]